MPVQIALDTLPAGVALTAAKDEGEVTVQTQGFWSSEDGGILVKHLEGLVSPLLKKLSPSPLPSSVDHLVAVYHRDSTARVYLNELRIRANLSAKKEITAGAVVFDDDVADVHKLEFVGVEVPDDAGILAVLSVGWRKGLYFDFHPLHGERREYDLPAVLGSIYAYMRFQNRLGITDEQWRGLLRTGWFPFIGLTANDLEHLVGHIDSGWDLDDLVTSFAEDLKARTAKLLDQARRIDLFSDHLVCLETAVRHFHTGDYLSTCSILYPRIEGVLRTRARRLTRVPTATTQKHLPQTAVDDPGGSRISESLLLPERFREYLESVYFANFDPECPFGISRNTVAHGVASESQMGLEASTIALLLVEQLLYLWRG